jgi:hypothetical protein
MDDFAFHVATREKLPRVIFGLEAPDPTVLVYFPSTPRRVKCTVRQAVYSVTGIFILVGHDSSSDASKTLGAPSDKPPRAEPLLQLITS